MQIQQLQYFLEIASEKSISRAAKNLYLSQPTLSQQVIKLEEELGIPLLVRHSKSVSLTDAGEQFEQHRRRVHEEVLPEQTALVETLRSKFHLEPMDDPYGYVRALQSDFDGSLIVYSGEYYDALGLERP